MALRNDTNLGVGEDGFDSHSGPAAKILGGTREKRQVLAEHFGCANPNAHQADADVEMLAGIIAGFQGLIQGGPPAGGCSPIHGSAMVILPAHRYRGR